MVVGQGREPVPIRIREGILAGFKNEMKARLPPARKGGVFIMENDPQFGFINDTLNVRTADGRDDVLLENLEYIAKDGTRYRCPIGSTTDGFSVPRCLQNIIPATGGSWFSACQHDAAYRGQLESFTGVWTLANLTRKEADKLILEAMKFQGVGFVMRHLIYWALRAFGWAAWRKSRY